MEAKNSVIGRENCRAKGGNPGFKVAILGAAGGIGQSLSLLMKMNPLVSLLHLYDVVNAPGVTADVSHMDTGAVVSISLKLWKLHIRLLLLANEWVMTTLDWLGPRVLGSEAAWGRANGYGSCDHTSRYTEETRDDPRWSV